jgi:peptidoglycan/LPS O-acetylase OafA/YrhL
VAVQGGTDGEFEPRRDQLAARLLALFRHGDLGIQIFFVISGLLMACLLMACSVRGYRMSGRFLARFALRRSVRLDPPYWVTIAAVIVTRYVSKRYIGNTQVMLPSVGQVTSHVL